MGNHIQPFILERGIWNQARVQQIAPVWSFVLKNLHFNHKIKQLCKTLLIIWEEAQQSLLMKTCMQSKVIMKNVCFLDLYSKALYFYPFGTQNTLKEFHCQSCLLPVFGSFKHLYYCDLNSFITTQISDAFSFISIYNINTDFL